MIATKQRTLRAIFNNTGFEVAAIIVFALLLGNIGALVDCVLHPDIPYFDQEHFIVGGFTALVAAALALLLGWYVRRLSRAEAAINSLEAILPICANCKKIKRNGEDPKVTKSWQSIDAYITEKTSTQFSHGICPECMVLLYPEHVSDLPHK